MWTLTVFFGIFGNVVKEVIGTPVIDSSLKLKNLEFGISMNVEMQVDGTPVINKSTCAAPMRLGWTPDDRPARDPFLSSCVKIYLIFFSLSLSFLPR